MKKVTLCALWMIILLGAVCMPAKASSHYGHAFTTSMYSPDQWTDKFTLSAQQSYIQLYVNPDSVKSAIKKKSFNKQVFSIKITGHPKDGSSQLYIVPLSYFTGTVFSSDNPVPTSQYTNSTKDDLLGTVRVCYDPATSQTNKMPSIRIYVEKLPDEYEWRITSEMTLYGNNYLENLYGEAPLMFDDNLFMTVDPILDLSVSDNLIGQQTINFISTASITHYTLYKKGTPNITVAEKYVSPTANNLALQIPRQQDEQTYWLGVNLRIDENEIYIARPIVVKPFHAIGATSCFQDNNADKDGLRHPKNVVSWTVPCANNADIMEDDQFIIERATKSDFSDAVSIGYHSLTPDTMVNGFGYYKYTDDDEKATINCDAMDKNDPYIYYRISRALVTAQWPNHKDLFVRVDSVGLDSYLPNVTGIRVDKQNDFNDSKKVTVKIKMNNPKGRDYKCKALAITTPGVYSGYMMDYNLDWYDRRRLTFEIKNVDSKWQWIWKRPVMEENSRIYFDQPNSTDSIWYTRINQYGLFSGVCMSRDTTYTMQASCTGQTAMYPQHINDSWLVSTRELDRIAIRTQWDDGQAYYFNSKQTVGQTRIYQWDENAQIVIKRWSPAEEHYEGVDYAKKTITIRGADVKFDSSNGCYYAEIEDVQAAPFTHFYYTANVDKSQSYFVQLEQDSISTSLLTANACYSEQFQSIKSLSAGLGTRPDGVLVNWEVDEIEGGGVTLQRRVAPLSGQTATNWETLDLPNTKLSEWLDQTAGSAIVYEYKLISWVSIRGQHYSKEKTTYGWRSYYGSAEGNMRLNNGAAMTGKNRVIVRCDSAFSIPAVNDSFGKVLMPGLSVPKRNDTIWVESATGHFELDSLPYTAGGMQYTIIPDCGCKMTHNQGNGTYYITLSDAKWNYPDVVFTCNDVRRFSGRVLYEMSTIPVAGVQFMMNGEVLRQGNGEPIVTDQLGNFSFYVPCIQMHLQLYKEGHTFEKDGYFRDLKDSTYFTPNQNYDNLIMTDLTKIQLVGRVVAGKRMAALPFGQGLTSNQLGDNIHLELRLDGNNTAWIFYDNNHLDRTSRTDSCSLTVKRSGVWKQIDQTVATFEKKRILINLKDTTGEFVVNLPPARYKITAMSADGYSTFFNADEGFEVLNLQDSITHATYQRIVHAPVSVTYEQEQYGLKTHYLGEKVLKITNLMNQEISDTVAWYDKATDQVTYTFDYPVFKQGNTYKWRVCAHEDFYYNGDKSRKPYEVALDGGELIVRNALESGTAEQHAYLDSVGQTLIALKVNNPTFTLKGETALRSVNMQVLYHGYYYDAVQVKGFVAGSQRREGGILNLSSQINVVDVLRDPPGSGSFMTRERGTTYKWSYNYTTTFTPTLSTSFSFGPAAYVLMGGFGTSVKTHEINTNVTIPANIQFTKKTDVEEGQYTMTLTNTVSTSNDPYCQGAMADVYIGTLTDYSLITDDNICVIDSACYAQMHNGFKGGAYHVLSEGYWGGKKRYLVVGELYKVSINGVRDFYYSQKHILGTVIPNLERQRDALLMLVDSTDNTDWQTLANTNDCSYYVQKSNDSTHIWYHPASMTNGVDVVSSCKAAINAWESVIRQNEETKVQKLSESPYVTHSLGQTAITHTEASSSYYNEYAYSTGAPSINAGLSGGRDSKGQRNSEDRLFINGVYVSFEFGFNANWTHSTTNQYIETTSAGTSYTLLEANNGYMDVEVRRIVNDPANLNSEIKSEVVDEDEYTNDTRVHNYVFYARGGATRNPWLAPDSTICYKPVTPLSAPMLKIDNPKIYIDKPVASNVPADEKAVFKVRLVNETEVNENTKFLTPNKFSLKVDDTTNPDGAKLSIDGMPLTQPLTFSLTPGQTIVKTLEVERGDAYDYPGITLEYRDDLWSLKDQATISIHYLPTSTPVHLASPMDKWTMNTLSDKDSTGYFIPVAIDGFDVNYDQFDHIELQYKKHTEGESQWVNLCSFFTSDSLYERCTSSKRMIESGTISNFRFYGEQDPMEMEYDLRAISFCRLGTGYVTRASNVVSGIKDTRVPTIFGLPQPANGIWNFDDAITLNFTEPIAYNYLDKTANFSVTGYTNDSECDYSSKLYFPGKTFGQQATTQVARNLSETDFTIDMTTLLPNDAQFVTLYSQGSMYDNGIQKLLLSYVRSGQEERLMAIVDGEPFVSSSVGSNIQLAGNIHRVGMAYSRQDSTISFIVDDHYIDTKEGGKAVCKANDKISLGDPIQELALANVRLWNHKLSERELANNRNKRLTGRETGLIAYWPMDETQGDIARDKANGADLQLQNVSWQTQNGIAVRANNKPLALQNATRFTTTNDEDYSLTFWFKINATQSDTAVLFRAGSENLTEKNAGKMAIFVQQNNLILRSNAEEFILLDDVSENALGQWHHLALSVSRTHNSAIISIDGQVVQTASAERIDGLSGDLIQLGSNQIDAYFDQLAFWRLALPQEYIEQNYNLALKGNEMGLSVYLPMHTDSVKSDNTHVPVFCPYNMEYGVLDEAPLKDKQSLMLPGAEFSMDDHAPIANNSGLKNLPFSWTSTGTALQLYIKEQDQAINNQPINLTIRSVEDLNGNSMLNAQKWTVYAHRNLLEWTEPEQKVTLTYNDQDAVFDASWTNHSGRALSYTIVNNCNWLSCTNTMGKVAAMGSGSTTITIKKDLAPGSYVTQLDLKDENQLVSTLTLRVTVEATQPAWKPENGKSYSYSMNLCGKVVVSSSQLGTNVEDMDERDIVGAFHSGKCIGKANLTVDKQQNTSFLYMNITGTAAMNKSNLPIEFRLWRASTGEIYLLNPDSMIMLRKNATPGCQGKPVVFSVANGRIQPIALEKGWNWISFNLRPYNTSHGVNNLFLDNSSFSDNDQFRFADGTFSSFYVLSLTNERFWSGDAEQMLISKNGVYQLYVAKACTVKVAGFDLPEDSLRLTLKPGWNSLPCWMRASTPIHNALADYQIGDKAKVGTVIKSHHQFAVATSGKQWQGSLQYLHPGEGYYVYHLGDSCSVRFSQTASTTAPERKLVNGTWSSGKYSTMMPLIAQLHQDMPYAEGDVIVALAGGEEIGRAEACVIEGQPYFLIALNAEERSMVNFQLVRDGEVVAESEPTLQYNAASVAGSIESPFIIDFSTIKQEATYPYYTPDGKPLPEDYVSPTVIVTKNKKVLRH